MIPRDHHDLGVGQLTAKAREFHVRQHDGRVRRSHLVKHVARNEHQLRRELDDLVQRLPERVRDVMLALVDSARSQPLKLAEAEMQVREMYEAQTLVGESVNVRCGLLNNCDDGSYPAFTGASGIV